MIFSSLKIYERISLMASIFFSFKGLDNVMKNLEHFKSDFCILDVYIFYSFYKDRGLLRGQGYASIWVSGGDLTRMGRT